MSEFDSLSRLNEASCSTCVSYNGAHPNEQWHWDLALCDLSLFRTRIKGA